MAAAMEAHAAEAVAKAPTRAWQQCERAPTQPKPESAEGNSPSGEQQVQQQGDEATRAAGAAHGLQMDGSVSSGIKQVAALNSQGTVVARDVNRKWHLHSG